MEIDIDKWPMLDEDKDKTSAMNSFFYTKNELNAMKKFNRKAYMFAMNRMAFEMQHDGKTKIVGMNDEGQFLMEAV